MIVLDASVVVDLLLHLPPHAEAVEARLLAEAGELAAPHLLDAEVAQVLRRHVRARELPAPFAEAVLADLAELPLVRYPHTPLLPRAFALREKVTVYDGLYLALAEALEAPLLTRDRALAHVPACAAAVEVVG